MSDKNILTILESFDYKNIIKSVKLSGKLTIKSFYLVSNAIKKGLSIKRLKLSLFDSDLTIKIHDNKWKVIPCLNADGTNLREILEEFKVNPKAIILQFRQEFNTYVNEVGTLIPIFDRLKNGVVDVNNLFEDSSIYRISKTNCVYTIEKI